MLHGYEGLRLTGKNWGGDCKGSCKMIVSAELGGRKWYGRRREEGPSGMRGNAVFVDVWYGLSDVSILQVEAQGHCSNC